MNNKNEDIEFEKDTMQSAHDDGAGEDNGAGKENGAGEDKRITKAEFPISRRAFAIGAIGFVGIIGLGGVKYLGTTPICRPPGGQNKDALIAACIHCEKCREVCPNFAIKPAHLETGILNVRTPQMDFKSGWCDFCQEANEGKPLCEHVCPTNALKLDSGATLANTIIGLAGIKKDWCLAYMGLGCRVCFDTCPYGAIELDKSGLPHVIASKCNGCGKCELRCVSMSSGSLATGVTDRAITIKPIEAGVTDRDGSY